MALLTRVVVSALTLILLSAIFLDIHHRLTPSTKQSLLCLQLGPHLIQALSDPVVLLGTPLLILAVTLLLGRVYCAMLCPLGASMDLLIWIRKRTLGRSSLKLRHRSPGSTRWIFLLVGLGTLPLTALIFGFIEPYSLFGRVQSILFQPLLAEMNNLVYRGFGFRSPVVPVNHHTTSITVFLMTWFFFLLVVALAWFRGRLWCNSVCPIGTLLGLFARFALFRIRIDSGNCNHCSLCETVCRAQCIDHKRHLLDITRCTMCMDCTTVCRNQGIHLSTKLDRPLGKLEGSSSPSSTKAQAPLHRRSVLGMGASSLLLMTVGGKENQSEPSFANPASGPGKNPELDQNNRRASLPPGAVSLEHYTSRCTACQLCVSSCPNQILTPSTTELGWRGIMQPYMDFRKAFCSFECNTCSMVCPTGAILPQPLEQRRLIQTGVAHLYLKRCVVETHKTNCGACAEHCPTQAVHMVKHDGALTLPVLDSDLCIGCGACETICPVSPKKAIVIQGLLVHAEAKPPRDLGNKNVEREVQDFPF